MLLGRNGDVGSAADSRGVAGGRLRRRYFVMPMVERCSARVVSRNPCPSSARFPCKPVSASPPHTWATAHQVPLIHTQGSSCHQHLYRACITHLWYKLFDATPTWIQCLVLFRTQRQLLNREYCDKCFILLNFALGRAICWFQDLLCKELHPGFVERPGNRPSCTTHNCFQCKVETR